MDIFEVITLFGGLGLFLYGMNLMGDGLTKTAGGKLEVLLERMSSTPIKGMLLGTVVTAVVQSSSATTVMVVGFVNSGIMKLSQATGIVLGANLGATVTPWIIGMSGISGGEHIILRLLNPSSFAPILGVVGAFLYVFTKPERNHDIGRIFLGFFILMTGMGLMSGSVEPLADSPEFISLLTAFSKPVVGLLVGTFVTAVIQSSSASIGILQALAISGAVTYGTAIPIVMGQNIGTCISAMLSSIGARTNARRSAFIHLYFNILKVILCMILFYSINYFVHFSFLGDYVSPFNIAMIHTLLNIFSVAVFMPFTKQLEKLAVLTVKERERKEDEEFGKYKQELMALDERFLDNPVVAVEQCLQVTRRMAELTAKSILSALDLIYEFDKKKFDRIDRLESAIDIYEDRVGTYIVKLSQRTLSVNDSNRLSIIFHSISNFERISDHAINIASDCKKMNEKGRYFSDDGKKEIEVYVNALKEIVINTVEVFETFDIELAKRIEPLEEVIDNINEKAKRHHIKRLRSGNCTVDMGVHFDNIINDMERVADHCSNIAVTLIEINDNVYETHEYLEVVKHTQSEEFKKIFKEYDEKFHL